MWRAASTAGRVHTLTWELISVTRSDSSVTATGVGSSLEAGVSCLFIFFKNNNDTQFWWRVLHITILHLKLLTCMCVGLVFFLYNLIINRDNTISHCQAIFHFAFISYWVYFIEMILYSWCHTSIDAIRVVSSRGSQTLTNGSRGCVFSMRSFQTSFYSSVELSSFSLWPLNICYTMILFTATVSVRIRSEDFNQAEASGSIQISWFFFVAPPPEVMSNVTCLNSGWIKGCIVV